MFQNSVWLPCFSLGVNLTFTLYGAAATSFGREIRFAWLQFIGPNLQVGSVKPIDDVAYLRLYSPLGYAYTPFETRKLNAHWWSRRNVYDNQVAEPRKNFLSSIRAATMKMMTPLPSSAKGRLNALERCPHWPTLFFHLEARLLKPHSTLVLALTPFLK